MMGFAGEADPAHLIEVLEHGERFGHASRSHPQKVRKVSLSGDSMDKALIGRRPSIKSGALQTRLVRNLSARQAKSEHNPSNTERKGTR
jgi:hypothetical protein